MLNDVSSPTNPMSIVGRNFVEAAVVQRAVGIHQPRRVNPNRGFGIQRELVEALVVAGFGSDPPHARRQHRELAPLDQLIRQRGAYAPVVVLLNPSNPEVMLPRCESGMDQDVEPFPAVVHRWTGSVSEAPFPSSNSALVSVRPLV